MPAIVSTSYAPSIQYITKFVLNKEINIEAHENFQKRSDRNRCRISTAQGIKTLTIPLRKGKNEQMPIRNVQIAYDDDWIGQHLKALQTAYGKSPFYLHYVEQIERILAQKFSLLFDLNHTILLHLLEILQIKCTISFTVEYRTPGSGGDGPNRLNWPVQDDPYFRAHPYAQVFEDKVGFLPNLSILDLLFCYGPESLSIIRASCKDTIT